MLETRRRSGPFIRDEREIRGAADERAVRPVRPDHVLHGGRPRPIQPAAATAGRRCDAPPLAAVCSRSFQPGDVARGVP